MPTSPFVEPDGWKIQKWERGPSVPEGIPEDAFQLQSILLVGVESVAGSDSYSLQWLDQSEEPCSVSGLHPDPESDPTAPKLKGENLLVKFGLQEARCNLTLTLHFTDSGSKVLRGEISIVPKLVGVKGVDAAGPDIGSGTFTATTNAGGGNAEYTHRPKHHPKRRPT